MSEKKQLTYIKSIINLIDYGVSNGIKIEQIESSLSVYIEKIKERELKQTQKKKKTRKKKIARPPLFISDSSDNEIANN